MIRSELKQSRSNSTQANSPAVTANLLGSTVRVRGRLPSFGKVFKDCLGESLLESKNRLASKTAELRQKATEFGAIERKVGWEVEREARRIQREEEHQRLYEELAFRELEHSRELNLRHERQLA
jgi:hypothetical protein